MRAVVCEQLGDPTQPLGSGVLRLVHDQPVPELKPGHVRIRVTAASLNFPDALQVQGSYQVRPPLPFVPGSEVAGIVVAVSQQGVSSGLRPGDLVCAVNQGDCFAEEVVAPAASTWRLPGGVDVAPAAALPIAFGTAHLALKHRARLAPGQCVLVLGASGGVGTAAVQLARLMGAGCVIAVTRGADKAEYLRSLGATHVIDTAAAAAAAAAAAGAQGQQQQPLHKLIAAVAPRGGVDVVFDPVGGAALASALKCVKWGASYLVIGFASGDIPKVPANLLLVKNTTLHGVFWGSYMQHDRPTLDDGMRELLGWVADGSLRVHVSHTFALEQLPQAMSTLLQRRVCGKVLISMQQQQQSRL